MSERFRLLHSSMTSFWKQQILVDDHATPSMDKISENKSEYPNQSKVDCSSSVPRRPSIRCL